MRYINTEEVKKAIKEGKGIDIDEILEEFKGLLKEVYRELQK